MRSGSRRRESLRSWLLVLLFVATGVAASQLAQRAFGGTPDQQNVSHAAPPQQGQDSTDRLGM